MKKTSETFIISRHRERLKEALAVQRKAWKTKDDVDTVVLLVADAFRLADDLKLPLETLITNARYAYERGKFERV